MGHRIQQRDTSDAATLADLIPSVDYCERTSWIEGYSWFMSRITGDPHNSLLSTNPGVLTAAGQAYVQMPVHQTQPLLSHPRTAAGGALCDR